MRVPRDLLPFVMPSDFFAGLTLPAFDILSPAPTCVHNKCDPDGTPNTELPPAHHIPLIVSCQKLQPLCYSTLLMNVTLQISLPLVLLKHRFQRGLEFCLLISWLYLGVEQQDKA